MEISFTLQIGQQALDNPAALGACVREVLNQIKASGLPVGATVAPAAPAAATVAPAAPAAATVAPAPAKGQWEANYGVAFNTSFLRYTATQSRTLATVPPVLLPAIREGLAKYCLEHGRKNGDLQPDLLIVGDQWEWVAPAPATVAPAAAAESEEDWQEPPCELESIDTAALFE